MEMAETRQFWLDKAGRINQNRSNGQRKPHKVLLLLVAIRQWQAGVKSLPFEQVDRELNDLLKAYAPPVKTRHQPELPYWHLQSDGLWNVPGSDEMPRVKGGFPTKASLRRSSGALPGEMLRALDADPLLAGLVLQQLLRDHFPESIQQELVDRLGLSDMSMAGEDNVQLSANTKRARDPQFRDMVLRAYDYRCAITGYQLLLGGTAFGCEAAHVKWHAAGGPDRVDNGIALCPNMHLLFDRGCISLTDDRRILISNELSGSEDIVDGIRQLSGKKMAQPVKGSLEVDSIFIRWHREPRLGGVFRGQALPV